MKQFTQKPIIVIGDVMLDRYIIGTAHRLSPEAPVPVVSITGITHRLGGAGNVCANIKSLGGTPILISVLGNGDNNDLYRAMDSAGISIGMLFCDEERLTTTKTRIIANNQQIARMDRETLVPISDNISDLLENEICKIGPDAAAVIISDYAKGVVTEHLVASISRMAHIWGIPVFVDPKVVHADFYKRYHTTCITPNHIEAEGMAGIVGSLAALSHRIFEQYTCKYVLITCGDQGMYLTDQNSGKAIHAAAQHVFDVSGAGDTVIAALTLAYASGYTMLEAAKIANAAAGIVVGKHGTATVTLDELKGQINV